MKINAKHLLLGLICVLLITVIVIGILLLQKSTNVAEPVAETIEVEETKVDSNDLLHTLVWKDDKEKVEEFKKETISGYDKTIEEVFSNPAEDKEETSAPIAYNIINWSYAEYNDNIYLSLNYNYDNSNYNVVFYKDIHDNVNIAELYIDNNKYDKESFTTWADKVFIEVTPTPTPEATPTPTETPTSTESPKPNVNNALVEDAKSFVLGKEFLPSEPAEWYLTFSSNGKMTAHNFYGTGGEPHENDAVVAYSITMEDGELIMYIGDNGKYYLTHGISDVAIELKAIKGGIYEGWWSEYPSWRTW